MTLLHPVDALIQAGVSWRRAYRLVAALDRLGYKIVANSETLQRHDASQQPPHKQGGVS